MAAPPANETLYNIFELLSTLANDYEDKKNKKPQEETSNIFGSIAPGLTEAVKGNAGVGQQIEALAKGLDMLEKVDVSESDIQKIAGMFTTLGSTISGLNLDDKTSQSVYALANAIVTLGNINGDMIDNIIELNENFKLDNVIIQITKLGEIKPETLKTAQEFFSIFKGGVGQSLKEFVTAINEFEPIDSNIATSIADFFKDLRLDQIPELTKEATSSIQTISRLLSSFIDMTDKVSLMSAITMPIKGKFVGKAVAKFFKAINESLPKKEIKTDLKGISDIFNGIIALSQVSTKDLIKALNPKTVDAVAGFFKAVIESLPKEKEVKLSLAPITDLIKIMTELTFKKYVKMRLLLTEKNGARIGGFFKAILADIPKDTNTKPLKNVVDFLNQLVKVNVVSLMLLKATLSPKFGEKINGFIKNLVTDFDSAKARQLKSFSQSVNTLSKSLLLLTGSILLMAGGMALLGISKVVASGVALVLFTKSMLSIMKKFAQDEKNIRAGARAVNNIVKVIAGITASVLALTVAAKIIDSVNTESIIFVGVMMGMLTGVAAIMMKMSKKWQSSGKNVLPTMAGISVAILSAALSIKLIANVVEETEPGKLWQGIGMLTGTLVAMTGMVFLLSKVRGRSLSNANKTLMTLTACLLGVTFAIGIMAETVHEHEPGTVIAGTLIVIAAMAAMIGMVKLVSMIKSETAMKSVGILGLLTVMTLGISLMIKEVFVPIGKFAGEAFMGAALVMGTVSVMIWMVKKLSHKDLAERVPLSLVTFAGVALITAGVALIAKELFIPIGDRVADAALGGVVVMVSVAAMVGATYLLSKIKGDDLIKATAAFAVVALITAGTALIAKELFIPIGDKAAEAALGGGVVMLTTLAMVGITYLVSKIKPDDALRSLATFGVIALITAGTALVVKELFVPIGKYWKEAALGALVVLGTVTVMGAMSYVLSRIEMSNAQMMNALKTVLVMGAIIVASELAVAGFAWISSYMKKENLTEEDLILTGKVMGALLGGFTILTIGLGALMKIPKMKDIMAQGAMVLAGIEILVAGASGATLAFVALARDMKDVTADDMKAAGLTVAAVLGGMGLLVAGVGALMMIPGAVEVMATGAAVVAGLAIVTYAVMELSKGTVADLAEIAKHNVSDMTKGGLMIEAILASMGLLVAGAGALMMIPGAAMVAAAGAAAITGLAVVIDLVTKAAKPFCADMAEIASMNPADIKKGSDITTSILNDFGEIMALAGLLSPVILAGEIVMTPLLGVMALTGRVGRSYSEIMLDILELNERKDWKTGPLKQGYDLMDSLISSYRGLLSKFGTFGSVFRTVMFSSMLSSISDTGKTITGYTDVILNTLSSLSKDLVGDFYSILCGDSDDDKKAMIPAMKEIISQFIDVLPGLLDSIKLDYALQTTRNVLNVVSKYIDVVAKVAKLTYITGYDSNGKPMFDHIEPETFGEAAKVVTTGFFDFVKELKTGFDGINVWTLMTIRRVSGAMNPLIKTIGKFVDVIMKVATGVYVSGFDRNGNPEFTHITSDDFKNAADVVTTNFIDFVKSLDENSKTIENISTGAVKKLGKAMIPMMNAIGGFADAILKLATSTIVISDAEGKSKTIKLEQEDITDAAVTLTSNFVYFMRALIAGTNNMSRWQAGTIKKFAEGIAPLMSSIGSFADAILKVASGTYVVGYNKDGKEIYKKITDTEFANAADKITDKFIDFIRELTTRTKNMKEDQVEAIKSLSGSMGPIMTSVGTFANAIITLAAGSYQSGTNPDGSPKFSKLEYDDVKKAAGQVIGYYSQFVRELLKLAIDPNFKESGAEAMKALGDAVGPVMNSVLDFSKMLVEIMKPQGEITDKNGKRQSFQLDVNTIGDAATKIANAYMSFIKTLVDKLQNDKELEAKVVAVKGTMSKMSEVASSAAEGSKSMADLVKALEEIKGLDDISANNDNSIAKKFVNAIYHLTNELNTQLSDFNFRTLRNTVTLAGNMLASYVTTARNFKVLNDTLRGIEGLENTNQLAIYFLKTVLTLGANIKANSIPRPIIYKNMLPFVKTVIATAKQLKTLKDVMAGDSLKDACEQFVEDINILTNPTMNAKMMMVTGNLYRFGNELSFFTGRVGITSDKTVKFAKVIHKTREELEKLDDALIKRDKERVEVLDRMANKFQAVAESIENVSKQIENLDENKILNNFRNIATLLETTKSAFANPNGNQNNISLPTAFSNQNNGLIRPNQTTNNVNNITNQNNTNNPVLPMGGGLGMLGSDKVMVTFEFKGQQPLYGFMSTKVM